MQSKILILQSCDSSYQSVLNASQPANQTYARQHGYDYHSLVANCSGIPGTGNWNRYFLLRDAIFLGKQDWAFWMDADAVVRDPSVKLESIINRTPTKALIACRGSGKGNYDINNGVFFLNLRHPIALELVNYMITIPSRLAPNERPRGDQFFMQHWLRWQARPKTRIDFIHRYTDKLANLFNYEGQFIFHALRYHGNLEERVGKLKRAGNWARHYSSAR